MAFFALLAVMLLSPFVAVVGAIGRAVILFWPTMLLLGAVHSYIPAVPALGYAATFFVIALISVLIPVSSPTPTPSN